MKSDPPSTPPDLRALCRQAGERAAGWRPDTGLGASAAPGIDGGTSARQRRLKRTLVGASGLLALAVVAAQLGSGPADLPAANSPLGMPAQTVAPPWSAAGSAVPPAAVQWQGDELSVDFDRLPLPQAVQLLAQATATAVAGAQSLQPVAVSLQLRTRDLAAAWRQLLHEHATFQLHCSGSSCQLQIDGNGAASAAPAPAAPAQPATPAPADAGELESQPDGSC